MYQYNYKIRKPKKSFSLRLLPLLFILILLGIAAWVVQVNHLLEIKQVSVRGDNELRSKAMSDFLSRNVHFLLNPPAQIVLLVSEHYPDVEKISSSIDIFSRTLHVSYASRVGHFLWCKQQGQCFIVDANGIVFATSPISQASFLTKIQDTYFGTISVGNKIPDTALKPLLAIEAAFKEKKLSITYIALEYIFSVKLIQPGAPEVRFTLSSPIAGQLNSFNTLRDSLSADEFRKLQYVDVRIKDKIYYK